MKKILIKSLRDFTNYAKNNLGAFIFTVIIPTLVFYVLERDVDYLYIENYLFILAGFLILVFHYFLLKRLILNMSKNDIYLFQIPSSKNPKDKLLIKIRNDNDEDFTDVSIELIAILVDPIDILVHLNIKSDNKYFLKGLKERGNTILGNGSAEIEIAENMDGRMRILIDDIAEYDILSGKQENQKREIFSLLIKVNGKIDSKKGISHLYRLTFLHYIIDETFILTNGNNQPELFTKIEWREINKEISPTKDKRLLKLST